MKAYKDWPTQVLLFDPLPEGVKVKSVKCTITDRTGEPKAVRFRLEDVPLPDDGR